MGSEWKLQRIITAPKQATALTFAASCEATKLIVADRSGNVIEYPLLEPQVIIAFIYQS